MAVTKLKLQTTKHVFYLLLSDGAMLYTCRCISTSSTVAATRRSPLAVSN
jgi:hypothetical protein